MWAIRVFFILLSLVLSYVVIVNVKEITKWVIEEWSWKRFKGLF